MPLTQTNIPFQLLSLATLAAYCWMVNRHGAHAVECLVGRVRLRAPEEGENRRPYDSFVAVALTLGALSAGLGAVKVAAAGLAAGTGVRGSWQWLVADAAGTAGIGGMPVWVAPAAAVAVAAAVVALAAAQGALVAGAGAVTLSRGFTREMAREKRNSLAALSVVATPLVAMWTGIDGGRDRVVAYLIVGVAVVWAALFVVHTLLAFVRQKVSVLVWFLYLCTVEIFPVCAVALAVMKNV